jgi:hypothetical protein
MDIICLEETKSTPSVLFDTNKNVFHIIGKSLPENAMDFYKPLYDWVEEFCNTNKDKGIELNVELEYLNSSSIKLVFLIFNKVNDHFLNAETDEKICINWGYNVQDELIKMKGEEFKEYLDLPFNVIAIG